MCYPLLIQLSLLSDGALQISGDLVGFPSSLDPATASNFFFLYCSFEQSYPYRMREFSFVYGVVIVSNVYEINAGENYELEVLNYLTDV